MNLLDVSVFNSCSLKEYDTIRCDIIRLISDNLDIVNRVKLLSELSSLVQYRIDKNFAGYRGHINFLNNFLRMYGFSIVSNYIMGSNRSKEDELLDSDTNLMLFKEVFESDDNLMRMCTYFDSCETIEGVYNGLVDKSSVVNRLERQKEYYLVFDLGNNLYIHQVIRFYKICCMLGWDLNECSKYAHLTKCDYVPADLVSYISDSIKYDITIDVFGKTIDSGECLVIYIGKDKELYNPYFILPLDGSSFCYVDTLRCLPYEQNLIPIIEMIFSTKIVHLRPLSDLSRICLHGYTKCIYPTPRRFKELTVAPYASTMSIERVGSLAGMSQETCMQLMVNFMDFIMNNEYDHSYCFYFFERYITTDRLDFVFSEKSKALVRLFTTTFCSNYLNYLSRICLNYLYMEDKAYVMSKQYKHDAYTNYMNGGLLLDYTDINCICRTILCMSQISVKDVDLDTLSDMVSVLNYVTNNRLVRLNMLKYMIGIENVSVINIDDDKFVIDLKCYSSSKWEQTFRLYGDCMQKSIPLVSCSGYKNTSKVVQAINEDRLKFYLGLFFTSRVLPYSKYLNNDKAMSPSSRKLTRTYLVDEFLLTDINDSDITSTHVCKTNWMPYDLSFDGNVIQSNTGSRFELLKSSSGMIIGRRLPDDINLQHTSLFTN